jgi:hypothetical protein
VVGTRLDLLVAGRRVAERVIRDRRVEFRLQRIARLVLAELSQGPAARHLVVPDLLVVAEDDLGSLDALERVDEEQLVLRDKSGRLIDVERHLLRVGHHEGQHVLALAVEVVLAEVAQRSRAVERLAQEQVRQAPLVLRELLLARLVWRDRGHSLRAVVVGACPCRRRWSR